MTSPDLLRRVGAAVAALVLLVALPLLAATPEKPGLGHLFSAPQSPELQAMLSRYHLKAGRYEQPRAFSPSAEADRERYRNVKGRPFPTSLLYLLYTPDSRNARKAPLIVYFPGSGEVGSDQMKQFRQRSIFDIVTSADFQDRHPCFFLAVSLPDGTRTLYDGLPGEPSAMQDLVMGAVRTVAAAQQRPLADMDRLYSVGFSLGGECAYGIALAYPGCFAGTISVASFPPPAQYVSEKHPGSWWHIYNEGDYTVHGVTGDMLDPFVDRVRALGGEFRTGTYPCDGHNAWSAAWRESAAWDWLFSKSLGDHPAPSFRAKPELSAPRSVGKSAAEKMQETVAIDLTASKCTASAPGKGRASQPAMAVDGLDGTAYVSGRPMKKGDWFAVEFPSPVGGVIVVKTGHAGAAAKDKLAKGHVEVSTDGLEWKRRGHFSGKSGECEVKLRDDLVKFVRVLPEPDFPRELVVREIAVVPQ